MWSCLAAQGRIPSINPGAAAAASTGKKKKKKRFSKKPDWAPEEHS